MWPLILAISLSLPSKQNDYDVNRQEKIFIEMVDSVRINWLMKTNWIYHGGYSTDVFYYRDSNTNEYVVTVRFTYDVCQYCFEDIHYTIVFPDEVKKEDLVVHENKHFCVIVDPIYKDVYNNRMLEHSYRSRDRLDDFYKYVYNKIADKK